MPDRSVELCERIREHCRLMGNYGLDAGWEEMRGYIDEEGNIRYRIVTHDPETGFEFPPATEEQLQATEAALGLPLPPMLHALYSQVANGGFGPGFGITGAKGAYYFGNDGRYQTIDMCTDSNPLVEYIDLSQYEQEHGNPPYFELRERIQPAHFWHLCYHGCSIDDCIDGYSGRIYQVSWVGSLPDSFLPNNAHPGEFVQEAVIGYWRIADSLEEYLELWLNNEVLHPFG
ncbi:MAG TPA: SMI1/KNR4 family protein [Ktedonobacteraceae bacterium]|jgi:hypothetical protein|nr:SMI1/KNR4 family protein [Ktedonobacteraceae bacterium]